MLKKKIILTLFLILFSLVSFSYAADKSKPAGKVASFNLINPRYRLIGTMVKNNDSQSSAVIRDISIQKDKVYKIGQIIDGYYITKIKRGQIQLLRAGKLFFLSLPLGGGDAFITVVSDRERLVDRTALNERYRNLNELLTAGFVFPQIEKGKIIGLKILRINDKKIGELSGMKEGDIVLSVNEHKLTNLNQALEVYSSLRQAPEFNVKVKRNNKILTYTYYMNQEGDNPHLSKAF